MKAAVKTNALKAILVLFIFSMFAVSCSKKDAVPPVPTYTKAVVVIKSAEKVTQTTATVVARVVPNEVGTSVSFEYKTISTNWVTVTVPTLFSGNDSVTVTSDLTGLSSGTDYSFRAKATNKGGETVSYESNFKTVAYLRPVVAIKPAEKVKLTSATIVAKVIPNEDDTKVSFEYKTTDTDWMIKELPLTFKGKDSVTVTFDLPDLKLGTVYSFRVRAINAGGESISADNQFETYSVLDFDDNGYHIVTIGTQTWLRENFKGTHYANGDLIANVTDPTIWSKLTTGAYCWYNNDPEIGKIYGGLYNFYIGTDSRGLIVGWHTPTYEEWTFIRTFLDGVLPANWPSGSVAGPKMTEIGYSHWKDIYWIPPTNTSGFTALPNGSFEEISGSFLFVDLRTHANFWTSSSYGGSGMSCSIYFSYNLNTGLGGSKNSGYGLRLMKN
jgi:uncharacterized protein (TIGR02145 family)